MHKKSLREAKSVPEARAILRDRKMSQTQSNAEIPEGSPQIVVTMAHAVGVTLGRDTRKSQGIII